jgi:hypothetical protein
MARTVFVIFTMTIFFPRSLSKTRRPRREFATLRALSRKCCFSDNSDAARHIWRASPSEAQSSVRPSVPPPRSSTTFRACWVKWAAHSEASVAVWAAIFVGLILDSGWAWAALAFVLGWLTGAPRPAGQGGASRSTGGLQTSSKEIREAVSDRGCRVRSRGEAAREGAPGGEREPRS